jgi:hypothetical protein
MSHVEDGGSDMPEMVSLQQSVGHWLVQDLSIPQVELPTETRTKELGQELADSERFLLMDDRFRNFMWGLKYMRQDHNGNG